MNKQNLKKELINTLKGFEKDKGLARSLRYIKGMPLGMLRPLIGNPSMDNLREAVCELWKNGDIAIYGRHYKKLKKIEKEYLLDNFISNDDWFIYAHVGRMYLFQNKGDILGEENI